MAEAMLAGPPESPHMDEGSQHIDQDGSEQLYENQLVNVPPIQVTSLESYIQKQRRDTNPFLREYEVWKTCLNLHLVFLNIATCSFLCLQSIQSNELSPCLQANLPENHKKNRFGNIKPCKYI